jgi:capsular exopolysaccharide synthesis family protein
MIEKNEQRLSAVLWRGKGIIALTLITTLAAVIAATAMSPKVYNSTAILQVGSGAVPKGSNESTLTAQQASQGLTKQIATLIQSRSILERLHKRVGLSSDELQSNLKATAVPETGLIELTLSARSPAAASRLASLTATGFIETQREDAATESDKLQVETQKRINALADKLRSLQNSNGPNSTAQRASLRASQTALTDQLANGIAQSITQGVTLAASPAAENSPSSPQPVLNVIAGLILGLLLGIGLAYLRARIEPSLSSAEDAEDAVRVPVLASIPLRRRFSLQDPVLTEAYEMLRANIIFRFSDDAEHVITFASYSSGEGKTSTVQGLAAAARRQGKSLLVVDADLRTRELSTRLGYGGSPGLSNLLADQGNRNGAGMVTQGVFGRRRVQEDLDRTIIAIEPGLSLLPAGPVSANAPALLGSDVMREVIAELRTRYPLILIDTPPSGHLADAGIVSSFSDAVVVVARVGRTNREDLQSAVLNLSHTRTPILGLVVVEPRSIDNRYFGGRQSRSASPDKLPVGQAG